MRLAFATVLTFWIPMASLAQQATVLSGDHSVFTRLVAPLPFNADWAIDHVDRTVTFSVKGFKSGFDVSDVFTLIKRDRIKDIVTKKDGFAIKLGCDCLVAPFVTQNRFVVLDIVSEGATHPAPFIDRKTSKISRGQARPQIDTNKDDLVETKLPTAILQTNQLIQPMPLPNLARTSLSSAEQHTLSNFQQRLAIELGTGATKGILTPQPGKKLPQVRRPHVDLETFSKSEAPVVSKRIDGLVNNLRISSSRDLVKSKDQLQTSLGSVCLENKDVDVSAWTDGRSFHEQTGEGRRHLYGDFDSLNRTAALSLAKNYIYFGFGAEAQEVLSLHPESLEENSFLLDIAAILENGEAPQGSTLRTLLNCETDIALWAVLAQKKLDSAQTFDPRFSLLALSKLPSHLRHFIAPKLSKRLLALGDADAAAAALRSLERLPSELPSSAKLAQANIAIYEGNIAQASTALTYVIEDNAEQSPHAIIKLIETQLASNQPVKQETISLLEAYAKEHSGDPLGAELRQAYVLALANSNQFDRAFEVISELDGTLDEEAAYDLRLRILNKLTDKGSNIVFLDHVFKQTPDIIGKMPVPLKLELTSRLLNLGFLSEAERALLTIPPELNSHTRRLLAARIALDLGQPMRAQAELSETIGEEADKLRADAKRMAGSHGEAYVLYRALKNESAAFQAALLAEDWHELDMSDLQSLKPILALSKTKVRPSRRTIGMLARTSAELEESQSARETLATMLRAPEFGFGNVEVLK